MDLKNETMIEKQLIKDFLSLEKKEKDLLDAELIKNLHITYDKEEFLQKLAPTESFYEGKLTSNKYTRKLVDRLNPQGFMLSPICMLRGQTIESKTVRIPNLSHLDTIDYYLRDIYVQTERADSETIRNMYYVRLYVIQETKETLLVN